MVSLFQPLWCGLMIRGAVQMLGVVRGHQRAAVCYKGAWLKLRLHIASFEPETSWRKEGDLCFSLYIVRVDVSLSQNGSQGPDSFLHNPPLLFWTCFLFSAAHISHRPRGQYSIPKSLSESSQQLPSVHDAAVPLLQDSWFVISICQHCS